MDKRAIGVFDSGLGGLTAVRRLHALMPQENIIYFGDTGRVPYGTRGRDIITKYARQDVAFLRQFDLKSIIIACNTVSAIALDLLSEENDIPIIGTVEPACRRAMTMTQTGRVGVIGTAATIRSGAYEKYLHKKDGTLDLFTQACPLFVPLVENGRVHRGDVVIETVVKEYLTPLKDAGVDTLILGCTHYPLLEEVIGDFMGPDVTLIDSGAEAANLASTQFDPNEGTGTTQYFVSDDPQGFDQLAELFLQERSMSVRSLWIFPAIKEHRNMKKDVWLTISSQQQFAGCDEENIDLQTAATLYERGGKYYIAYEESELTGLEGTKTTVKLDGKTVALIRTGTFPSHMLFAEDERHVGLYQTPVGSEMAIATHTSRVHNTIGENGGHLIIDYTVEVDNSLMGEHHFEMTVSTKPNIQVV